MKFNTSFRLRIGNRLFTVSILGWNSLVHDRKGITNETRDGRFVPFFDFQDNTPFDRIQQSLRHIQDEWGLGSIYVIQSYPRESYRAFALDTVEFRENIAILAETDCLDEAYLRSFARRRKSVLRVIPKRDLGDRDKLRYTLDNFSQLRPRSIDHAIFFHKMFGIPFTGIIQSIKLKKSDYESFR